MKKKYHVHKGNTYHQCAWVVKYGGDVIAEFWNGKDAQYFCEYKNAGLKEAV